MARPAHVLVALVVSFAGANAQNREKDCDLTQLENAVELCAQFVGEG